MSRLALAAVLLMLCATVGTAQAPDPLVRVRQLYLEAVAEEPAIELGLRAIEEIRANGAGPAPRPDGAVLDAYAGALVTLRAKHGSWPPARLRHLREGLALLDSATAVRPDHPEIRYLRLLSCYFLPGILGRTESVREDFAALAQLLPASRAAYPPELYRAMVGFVLQKGALDARARARLATALSSSERE